MQITASHLKTAAYIGIAGIGILIAFRAYRLSESLGKGLTGIPEQLSQASRDAAQLVTEGIATAKKSASEALQNTTDSVRGAIDSVTGRAVTVSGNYAVELPSDKWDKSTLKVIEIFNKKHGRGAKDYSGWHVYSDGTIITPAGDYLQMDYSHPTMDQIDGFAVSERYSPSGDSLGNFLYPSAQSFLDELSPPGYSGVESYYP